MEKDEHCNDCKFFNQLGKDYGECRRHSPQIYYESVGNISAPTDSTWPGVSVNDWFGDFQ